MQTAIDRQASAAPLPSNWFPIRLLLGAATLLWIGAVSTGLGLLWYYASAAGVARAAPQNWPIDSQIAPPARRPLLLMFFHPRCPCSRASMGELEHIVAQCQGKLDVRALFVKPPGTPTEWEQTDLWQAALALPGVGVKTDGDGLEADRFGAATSGYALLYGADGGLLFHGGITQARGHSGDNTGRSAIVELVTTGHSSVDRTSVFGCPLCKGSEGINNE